MVQDTSKESYCSGILTSRVFVRSGILTFRGSYAQRLTFRGSYIQEFYVKA